MEFAFFCICLPPRSQQSQSEIYLSSPFLVTINCRKRLSKKKISQYNNEVFDSLFQLTSSSLQPPNNTYRNSGRLKKKESQSNYYNMISFLKKT